MPKRACRKCGFVWKYDPYDRVCGDCQDTLCGECCVPEEGEE